MSTPYGGDNLPHRNRARDQVGVVGSTSVWAIPAGGISLAVGIVVLCGWRFGWPLMTSIWPDSVTMKPNTALAFVAAGLSLMLLGMRRFAAVLRPIAWGCAAVTLAIGLLTIAEMATGLDLRIDQLLFRDKVVAIGAPYPGRMSPLCAIAFAMLGTALLILHRSALAAQLFSLAALWVGVLTALGHLYGVPQLYGLENFSQMAIHTAITLIVLSSGVLLARSDDGPVSVLMRSDAGGLAARRLLPPLLAVLILFGTLAIAGERRGWFDIHFGLAAMVWGSIAVSTFLIWLYAHRLSQLDRERQHAEQKTAEQRDWLETTLTSIADAVITTDEAGRITFLNRVAEQLIGWTQSEAVGQPLERVVRLVDEGTRTPADDPVRRVLHEGAHITPENRSVLLVRRDGREIPIADSAAPLRLGRAREVQGAVWVFRDVRKERLAEAALRDSEAKLRSILANTQSAVFAKDREGRYFIANRHLAEMFDWPDETWPLGKTDADLYPPEMAEIFTQNDRLVLQEDAPREFEEPIVQGGQQTMYLVQKFPLRDAQGKTYGVCGIATDITRRKRTEQLLRRHALQQHAAAELGSMALMEQDLKRVFGRCVETAANVLDHEFCELLELLPDGQQLLLRDGLGWKEGLIGKMTVGTGTDSQGGYTLASGEPVVVEDLRQETRFRGSPLLRDHNVVSSITCVIPGPGGQPWGALGVHTARTVHYSKHDVNFLQTVAHIIGGVIQRHAAEQALRENEQRLRFTLEAARVGSWDWDIKSGHVSWSENLEVIHGRAPGSFGGTIEDVSHNVYPPDRPRLQNAISKAMNGDGLYEVDYRILRSDGSLGWLHSQGRTAVDDQGQPIRMAGICLDITERRRVEELTRLLAAAGAHLGQSLDYKSTLQIVAELLVPAWGDLCAIDLLGPDGVPQPVATAHSDPHRAAPAREVVRRFPPRGDDRHGFFHVVNTGEPELVAEITDEVLREAAQDEEHFRLLRELKLKSAVIVPLKARGRTLGAMTLCSADALRRYNQQDVSLLEELAIRCALAVDNARLYEEAQLEIELRKRTERLLAKAHDAAAAANAAKSEFLANMSHEIRTPMTAILGYTDILKERLDDPEDLEAVDTIRRNGRFLLEIINDILDLSKIEAGKLEVERQRFRPDQLVHDTLALMDVRAREKHLTLKANFEGAIPETIESDPTRLRQILINLLGNAVKFTQTGSVELRVRDRPDEEQLQFDVIDTGIGIEPDQLNRLFEPFTQGDTAVTQRFGGTGLGLTISRRLVELLGGEISVQSEPGKGSTFTFTIATGPRKGVPLLEPSAVVETAPEPAPPARRLDCRVLVVDDRTDVRFLAEHFIQEAGGDVETASNGEEALELVQRSQQNGHRIDVVLMDMQMPVLDGYEAAGRLRRQGFLGPIIALTANAMQGDRERCLQAGCDDYTSKPLDGPELIQLIAHYSQDVSIEQLRKRRADLVAATASPEPASPEPASPEPAIPRTESAEPEASLQKPTSPGGCRVLLVDDSKDVCRLMKKLLELRGHEVHTEHTGYAAIEAAQLFVPDVALLDLTLPDMSGCEVAQRLRSLPETQHTVLIAVSGHGDPDTLQQVEEAGFDHHALKPVDAEDLEQRFPKPSALTQTAG